MSGTTAVSVSRARNTVIAAYLGWTLDAFDFFILILTFDQVAKTFGASLTSISTAITLTLATRAIGAFIFGRLADKYGRKPILMLVVLLYSFFEALTGFAWSFLSFMAIRTLFGIAMGGEWGIGPSLVMETIPVKWRGWVSGLLQAGYPSGFLLASVLYGFFGQSLGWRGMFFIGAIPALLVFFINAAVEESPAFTQIHKRQQVSVWQVLSKNAYLAIYGVIMMAAFNFFSHGTQDIYLKAFLGKQLQFSHGQIALAGVIFNIGAIVGGIGFGLLSQRIGRRYAIAAACLLALLALYPWSHGPDFMTIIVSAFVMQVAVQGAWGVVPAHLNELSPAEIRGTFPGFVYQLGNFLASGTAQFELGMGAAHGGDYGYALMVSGGSVAVILALLVLLGPERQNAEMTSMTPAE